MPENIIEIVTYWWFRLCLATELYGIEKWERHTVYVLFVAAFLLFWIFNYSVLLPLTYCLFGFTSISEYLQQHQQDITVL